MSASVLDLIRAHAARAPEAPALIAARAADIGSRADVPRGAEPERVGYGELVARIDALAARLRAGGVRPAQRCGLVARQGAGFIELALAILAADACFVPIPDDHIGAVLDAFAERASLHHVALERSDGGRADFELRTRPTPKAVDGAGERDFAALGPAYLRFTSGTTSRRKGVILGHAAILARLDAANRGLGIGSADRILWLLPMAHHFVVSILLYLSRGAAILLPGGALARPILELASRERATVLYASPYHMSLLARDTSGVGLADLRLAISTAEGLRASTAREFAARFGRPVAQALGIIEVGLPVLNLRAAGEKPGALGRPLPDYDVWLRGEDGQPVPAPTSADKTGEICIRGPGLFDAYLEPWTPARAIVEPDGFRTGDQGYFDADGELFLVGRRANRINMAGMKFFSEEVEAVLDLHPGVRRSRVLAREHAHLGEIPIAEIEPADLAHPPTRAELTAHCRAQLATYKIPREFQIVASFPETATGKLARAKSDVT